LTTALTISAYVGPLPAGLDRSLLSSFANFALVATALPAEKAQRGLATRPHRLRKAFSVARDPTSERWRRNVGLSGARLGIPGRRLTQAVGLASPSRTIARTRLGKMLA
jgi:hypothetical protein